MSSNDVVQATREDLGVGVECVGVGAEGECEGFEVLVLVWGNLQ